MNGCRAAPKYIWLVYAAYLPQSAYDEMRATLSQALSHEDARAAFLRYVPEPEPTSEWNPRTRPSLRGVPIAGERCVSLWSRLCENAIGAGGSRPSGLGSPMGRKPLNWSGTGSIRLAWRP